MQFKSKTINSNFHVFLNRKKTSFYIQMSIYMMVLGAIVAAL